MMIGKFRQQDSGGYTGSIYGVGFSVPFVVLTAVSAKQGNAPDFVVFGSSSEEAGEFEIGAAWKKTSKAGKPYLSVKLDGPTLAAPINAAMIPQEDGSHALVWNRDSRKADDEAAAA